MSRHPTHWKEALHPRIPGGHGHGGEFAPRGGVSGAPKAPAGVVRKRPGQIQTGDLVLDSTGQPRKIRYAFLRPVGHDDHPGDAKVSKYVLYDWHGKIVRTRHGGGVSGTSLVDTVGPDWASKAADQVDQVKTGGEKLSTKGTGQTRRRPSAIGRGDVIVDSTGNARVVARATKYKAGHSPHMSFTKVSTYTFYDEAGDPIETRHGMGVSGTSLVEVVARRDGPPPPPKVNVVIRSFKDRIDDPAAIARFKAWETDMAKPGRIEQAETRREFEIRAYEKRLRSVEVGLKNLEFNVKQIYRNSALSDAEYQDAMDRETAGQRSEIAGIQKILAGLRDPNQHTVNYMSGLDEPHRGTARRLPAIPPNPDRPLAIYGDMLNAVDDTWHTYVALDALEQRVPSVLHQKVATHMAGARNGGIFVGAVPTPDLDDLQDLRNQEPRGWGHGHTWQEVDGVHRGGSDRVVGVGFTANTVSGIAKARGHHNMEGSPLSGSIVDGTVTLHEFGHALSDALTTSDGRRASEDPDYRRLHAAVVKQAGSRLNPYFRQETNGDPSAGAEEFFAEAFGIWARFDGTPLVDRFGNPIPAKDITQPGYPEISGGPVTWQEKMIQYEFGVDIKLARRLSKYFYQVLQEQGG